MLSKPIGTEVKFASVSYINADCRFLWSQQSKGIQYRLCLCKRWYSCYHYHQNQPQSPFQCQAQTGWQDDEGVTDTYRPWTVPDGHARSTLRLLEKIRLELDLPVGREAIRLALKNKLRPHMKDYWCIPPKGNDRFEAAMEDILDIYEFRTIRKLPVVCMDEKPYQCLSEIRESLPLRPEDDTKIDSEYFCEGTCNIFIFTELLREWHYSNVRKKRTALD